MERYDPEHICPKCGATDTHDTYLSAGYHGGSLLRGRLTPKEHISRHCRHCGYEWAEAPLDAPDAPAGEERE